MLVVGLCTAFPDGAAAQGPAAVYAGFTAEGGSGAWSGTVSTVGTPLPGATFTSTSDDSTSVGAGVHTSVGVETPFGAKYGDSHGQQYLELHQQGPGVSSRTVVTFDTPTLDSGWGFAVGDIDTGTVTIQALDESGAPVPAAGLGFQGGFNYCQATPMPDTCATPDTDIPVWNPDTATLAGTGAETYGASGWFEPTAAVKTLELTFGGAADNADYQLWLAALTTPQPPTETSVTTVAPGPPTSAATLGHRPAAHRTRVADPSKGDSPSAISRILPFAATVAIGLIIVLYQIVAGDQAAAELEAQHET